MIVSKAIFANRYYIFICMRYKKTEVSRKRYNLVDIFFMKILFFRIFHVLLEENLRIGFFQIILFFLTSYSFRNN